MQKSYKADSTKMFADFFSALWGMILKIQSIAINSISTSGRKKVSF